MQTLVAKEKYSNFSKIKYFQEKKQKFYKVSFLDDFEVSNTILLGSANSGQTSAKCCDIPCNVGTIVIKKL